VRSGSTPSNTTGVENTAIGSQALDNNPNGASSYNSATGFQALYNETTGGSNTAVGVQALYSNTLGTENTAIGISALYSNTVGSGNAACGSGALESNTSGFQNTAGGNAALELNTTGGGNTASGFSALSGNNTGSLNTASGLAALQHNNGDNNTASGFEALVNNSTGNDNIALGYQAGSNVNTGSNNIEIGSQGTAADANTIRLGTKGAQTATYIAGISGTAIKGVDVVVSSNGQLGILRSSARYKRDIQPLDEHSSRRLWQLRPVTFHYKQEPQGERQYGLIAEDVAKVYPELVVHGERGEIESVQYRELIPLMLNEMQRQQVTLTSLKAQNAALQARLTRLEQTSVQK
jgi:hypothetical protein